MKSQSIFSCSIGAAILLSSIPSTASNINPFQGYIESSFFDRNQNAFVHLRGSTTEKISKEDDVRFLSLTPANFSEAQGFEFMNLILSVDADIICFQRVSTESADSIYEGLHDSYSHFLYLDGDIGTLDFLSHQGQEGILIVSKFRIEDIQFNQSRREVGDLTNGFFDFVIKNEDHSLGHVYVANLHHNLDQEDLFHSFYVVVEKMQEDVQRMDEESIPFLLCGNLGSFEYYEEGKNFLGSYFRTENGQAIGEVLLLQTLPAFPYKIFTPEYLFLRTSLSILEDQPASLTLLKRGGSLSLLETLNNFSGASWNKNYTILCGGHTEIEADKDDKGNISLQASVSIDNETDNGANYSTEISAGGDTQGNVSCEGCFEYSYETESGIIINGEVNSSVTRDSEGKTSTKSGFRISADW